MLCTCDVGPQTLPKVFQSGMAASGEEEPLVPGGYVDQEYPMILEIQGGLNEHRDKKPRNPFTFLLPLLLAVVFVGCLALYVVQLQKHAARWSPVFATVNTSLGQIRGRRLDAFDEKGNKGTIFHFQGIPYTEHPPTGKHRFQPAQLITSPWRRVRDAAVPAAPCIQQPSPFPVGYAQDLPTPQFSEDCLHVSVWTPSLVTIEQIEWEGANSTPSQLLPVLFHVHGGGLRHGSAELLPMQNFAFNTQTVVVTVDFRLGPLGFLVTEPMDSDSDGVGTGGMNGFNDVAVALQWVQAHIDVFGGDPNQVTLSGVSQGAVAACVLGVSPRAAGLFQSMVLMSGSCTGTLLGIQSAEVGYNLSSNFKQAVGASTMEELQDLDVSLLGSWNPPPPSDPAVATTEDRTIEGVFGGYTHAFVDGFVLDSHPRDLYSKGKLNDMNQALVSGTATDGMFPYLLKSLPAPAAEDDFPEAVLRFASSLNSSGVVASTAEELRDELLGVYNLTQFGGDYVRAWVQMGADAFVVCPGLELATMLNDAKVETYSASFQFGPLSEDIAVKSGLLPAMQNWQSDQWVSHSYDEPLVFGVHLGGKEWPSSVSRFSSSVGKLYTSLNELRGGPVTASANMSSPWIPLNKSASVEDGTVNTMILDHPLRLNGMQSGFRSDKCTFWATAFDSPDA